MKNRNLAALYILQYLQTSSSPLETLTTLDILDHLKTKDITADRRFVYKTINDLITVGYPIKKVHANFTYSYYLSPCFSVGEAFFLSDAIERSPSLSINSKRSLRNKLITVLPFDQKAYSITPQKSTTSSTKENILQIIEILLFAIHKKEEITFMYFDYDVTKKKKYREKEYHIYPLAIISDNGKYYCIGYSLNDTEIRNYRIDKMDKLHSISSSFQMEQTFSIDTYLHNTFHMYSSKASAIVAEFSIKLLPLVYDQFGLNIIITKSNDSSFTASIHTAITPSILGWFLQNSNYCKILKPQSLIDQMKEIAITVIDTYQGGTSNE